MVKKKKDGTDYIENLKKNEEKISEILWEKQWNETRTSEFSQEECQGCF